MKTSKKKDMAAFVRYPGSNTTYGDIGSSDFDGRRMIRHYWMMALLIDILNDMALAPLKRIRSGLITLACSQ